MPLKREIYNIFFRSTQLETVHETASSLTSHQHHFYIKRHTSDISDRWKALLAPGTEVNGLSIYSFRDFPVGITQIQKNTVILHFSAEREDWIVAHKLNFSSSLRARARFPWTWWHCTYLPQLDVDSVRDRQEKEGYIIHIHLFLTLCYDWHPIFYQGLH